MTRLSKKIHVLHLLLILSTSLAGQNIHKISFNESQDVLQKISEITALYKLSQTKIYYENKEYNIKLPANFNVKDTAVAFIFFQGWENSSIPNHTLVLVGNYDESAIVIVDSNNNLDFSDDKQLNWDMQEKELRIELYNSKYNNARCLVKINRKYFSSVNQAEKVFQFISGNSFFNKNEPISTDYWWDVKRINYKTTTALLENDSIYIGLVDGTANGLFNDLNWDRVMIGNYNSMSISDELAFGGYIFKNELKIKINENTYIVKEVDPSGEYIILQDSETKTSRLYEGSIIPNYKFNSTLETEEDLYSLFKNNKFVLLDFWGTWCKPCVKNMPKLKTIEDKYQNLKIVGLIAHDRKEKALSFIKDYNIDWFNGFATDEMLNELFVEAFPRYILIDEGHKIVLFNKSLDEVDNYLSKK